MILFNETRHKTTNEDFSRNYKIEPDVFNFINR